MTLDDFNWNRQSTGFAIVACWPLWHLFQAILMDPAYLIGSLAGVIFFGGLSWHYGTRKEGITTQDKK